ncbi:MAG: DUF4938 domain-containing protein [Chloroflexaceae bacterium]|nr:DUF4938 domain-containing protein [Chloroflexaceae bacterium]
MPPTPSPEPISIIACHTLVGANIYSPQAGVVVRLHCQHDYSQRVRAALKDGAQSIGMVLAYLDLQKQPLPDQTWQIQVHFTTPQSQLGCALATYIVEGICAELRGDEEWERDGPLFALQQERRRQQPPVALLQLIAEATARRIPVTPLPDLRVLVGTGNRSWLADPVAFAAPTADDDDAASPPTPPPTPHWDALGSVPFYVVTGTDRTAWVARITQAVQAQGNTVQSHSDADLATMYAALADPTAEVLVLGLSAATILAHGVPFDRCSVAIVTDVPPSHATDPAYVRAIGLPILLATEAVYLHLADAALAPLAAYARCAVTDLSAWALASQPR